MNKEQKIKTYRRLVSLSLSAFCTIEALHETSIAGEYSPEQIAEAKNWRRALKECSNELALPTCSINKVENILQNLVNE